MDKKTLAILKKIYHYENGDYNLKLDRLEHKIPATVTQTDLNLLENMELKPNNFETFEHDNALSRLLKLRDHEKLTLEFAASMFLKGLTGEMPRGRQTLMSYLYIKHLYAHSFVGHKNCELCGLPKVETINKTHALYGYYSGHSWNELPLNFLIELEEALTFEKSEITIAEIDHLTSVLEFISKADGEETPGKLEKRLSSFKILAQTDKYKRFGILQTLSECGILPNAYIKPKYDGFTSQIGLWEASDKVKTSGRADVVLPFAGWTGENGVDLERAKLIFNLQN